MRYFDAKGMRLIPFADRASLEDCLDEMFRVGGYRKLADEDTGRDCLFYLDERGQVQFSFFPADHAHRKLFREHVAGQYFAEYAAESLFHARLPCKKPMLELSRDAYGELFTFLRRFSTPEVCLLFCIQHCEGTDGQDGVVLFGREKSPLEAFC